MKNSWKSSLLIFVLVFGTLLASAYFYTTCNLENGSEKKMEESANFFSSNGEVNLLNYKYTIMIFSQDTLDEYVERNEKPVGWYLIAASTYTNLVLSTYISQERCGIWNDNEEKIVFLSDVEKRINSTFSLNSGITIKLENLWNKRKDTCK